MQFMDKKELNEKLDLFDEMLLEDLDVELPEQLDIDLSKIDFDVELPEPINIDLSEMELDVELPELEVDLELSQIDEVEQRKKIEKAMAELEVIRQQHYNRLNRKYKELIMEYEYVKKNYPKTNLENMEKHIKFVEGMLKDLSKNKKKKDNQINWFKMAYGVDLQ